MSPRNRDGTCKRERVPVLRRQEGRSRRRAAMTKPEGTSTPQPRKRRKRKSSVSAGPSKRKRLEAAAAARDERNRNNRRGAEPTAVATPAATRRQGVAPATKCTPSPDQKMAVDQPRVARGARRPVMAHATVIGATIGIMTMHPEGDPCGPNTASAANRNVYCCVVNGQTRICVSMLGRKA